MNYSKKSLGQNFLRDKNVIKKIINSVEITGKDIFLETLMLYFD